MIQSYKMTGVYSTLTFYITLGSYNTSVRPFSVSTSLFGSVSQEWFSPTLLYCGAGHLLRGCMVAILNQNNYLTPRTLLTILRSRTIRFSATFSSFSLSLSFYKKETNIALTYNSRKTQTTSSNKVCQIQFGRY